ncbi:MAG: FliH/SctL family protein [Candidatus Sericytochromatia bacterium]
MKPQAKVIKAVKFEDGTYTIHSAPAPFVPTDVHGHPEAGLGPHAPGIDHAAALAAVQAEAKALVEQAQAEADFALKLAHEEAEAIRVKAQQDAELLRAQAAQAAQQSGFEQGLAAGQQAGYEAVAAEYSQHLADLMTNTEAAAALRQTWFANHEKDLVKMAVLIAQKILLTELSISRDSVLKLAAAALKRINDKTAVRLRVHPDDQALVMKAKGPLMLGVDNLTSLEIVADPGVGLGGCVVETRTGIVDARVATQLSEVATTLIEIPMGDENELDPVVLQAIRALRGGIGSEAPAPARASEWDDDFAPLTQIVTPQPVIAQRQVPAAPAPAPVAFVPVSAPEALPAEPLVEEALVPAAIVEAGPVQDWDEPMLAAPVAEAAPQPAEAPPEVVTQVLARMTGEEVNALTQALSDLLPPADEPEGPAPTAPSASAPLTRRSLDPSKRAADALAARLGQLKKGKGVARMEEEYDMSLLEGALGDEALEAIVRGVLRKAPGEETAIALDQKLVHDPTDVDAAADALAERLGLKKKPKRNWYDGVESLSQDGPSEREIEELANALADDRIDQIMHLVPSVAAPGDEQAEEAKPADLSTATDNLAKLLGKKKKGNRPWYEGIE